MVSTSSPKKRARQRKRRQRSPSASSSTSSSSTSDAIVPDESTIKQPSSPAKESSESSSESSSSESDVQPRAAESILSPLRPRSLSPSPPPSAIPPFLQTGEGAAATEASMREKFKKFWMASIADGFKDDLEQIRKEPDLTTARLNLLVDSLASGAQVFESTDVNEMELVLE